MHFPKDLERIGYSTVRVNPRRAEKGANERQGKDLSSGEGIMSIGPLVLKI
jgi:hypothetical protein